ncbi:MAG TPA: amidohydrolase family protein [Bacteroidota bacterium]|nr:amidohydrolase family protein [Bacteroidota bacterium]
MKTLALAASRTYFELPCLVCICLLIQSASASDNIPARPQDHPIAISGGAIYPVSGPVIERGTILFDKGKIVAVGTDVPLPPNTEIIHAEGKNVYPGLISSATTIGLTEIESVRGSVDVSETGTVNPNVRAEAAVNPESELIPVARANGITLVAATPEGALIAGTSAMIMLDGWTWEEMTLKAPLAMNLTWPEMTVQHGWWVRQSEEEQTKEREAHLKELANAFRDARAYMVAKKAESEKGLPYHNVDVRWEAMIPVLEGKIPLVVWADEVQQIEAVVAWADRENIRIIIGGGHDAWRVADLLKSKGIAVLAGGLHRLPDRRFEEYDEPERLPAKLHNAGILFAIVSQEEAAHERNLPYQASRAVAFGLPKEEALKALTLSPARIFGIADRVGSLEPGKDATLIVTTGDPLEIRSNVVLEFIQGKKIDLSSRHTRLYDKYIEKYGRMKSN